MSMTNARLIELAEGEAILAELWPGGEKSRREMLAKFRAAFLRKHAQRKGKR